MPERRLFLFPLLGLVFLTLSLALSACDILAQPEAASPQGTLTPTPTLDPSGYQGIAPQACLVGSLSTIQAEHRQAGMTIWQQGNLLAFQPQASGSSAEKLVAYLAPSARSSWMTGELQAAVGPDFTTHIPLAPNVLAVGDLTWSPDGTWLGFLAFRTDDSLYTIMAVHADGSGLTDLFPADLARTDNRSSQKAIIAWQDDQTLRVITSCGEQCRQAYQIDLDQSAGSSLEPTPIPDYKQLPENLQIQRHELEFEEDQFPKNMRIPHWSPAEDSITYVDRRGILWYLSIKEKTQYLLDIGLRDVYETQWSSDSSYLGIRAEDRIFIFQVPCQAPEDN